MIEDLNDNIKIVQDDCLVFMKTLADKSIDMILCDLPYGTTACKWDTIIPFEPLWEQYKRIIKDNGAIVLTASQPFTSALVMSNPDMFKYEWIWDKSNGSNPLLANINPMKVHENILVFQRDKQDMDTYQELRMYAKKLREYIKYSRAKMIIAIGNGSSQHFLEPDGPQWELCTEETYKLITDYFNLKNWEGFIVYDKLKSLYLSPIYNPQKVIGKPYSSIAGKRTDKGMPHLKALENQKTVNEGDRFPRSVLKINSDKGLHPTQKPVALFEYLIKTYTSVGDTILDNCIGSGTTAVAAINTGRNFIGIEMDAGYCDIANKRIQEAREKLISKLPL